MLTCDTLDGRRKEAHQDREEAYVEPQTSYCNLQNQSVATKTIAWRLYFHKGSG